MQETPEEISRPGGSRTESVKSKPPCFTLLTCFSVTQGLQRTLKRKRKYFEIEEPQVKRQAECSELEQKSVDWKRARGNGQRKAGPQEAMTTSTCLLLRDTEAETERGKGAGEKGGERERAGRDRERNEQRSSPQDHGLRAE